jgi:hypothetical protein
MQAIELAGDSRDEYVILISQGTESCSSCLCIEPWAIDRNYSRCVSFAGNISRIVFAKFSNVSSSRKLASQILS